jgi:GTP-binding protein HflX
LSDDSPKSRRQTVETGRPPTRTFVLHPVPRGDAKRMARAEARLDEAVGLAAAIELTVIGKEVVRIAKTAPATVLGRGAVTRLAEQLKAAEIGLVVFDCAIAPTQQRNLEKAWNCKVIDRTALILEIFGERARTSEGRLQVELAHLSYQRSRLVRSWTHLERQRGGFGFVGGPGESQIEIDRRLIDDRIAKIKVELETVKQRRELQRRARKRVPHPVVALVGYTNAGKSTLFNRITGADVLAKDLLFATLDPTMRGRTMPSGRKAIFSDTVGFISDLPTTLVAAFRATLEEVIGADVIMHVRDISHPDTEMQAESVHVVLRELGLGDQVERGLFEVLNKIDRLDAAARERLLNQIAHANTPRVAVSALTGEGCDTLIARLDGILSVDRGTIEMKIPLADGAGLAWVYRHGDVVGRRDDETHAHLVVRIDDADLARFRARNRDRAGAGATIH